MEVIEHRFESKRCPRYHTVVDAAGEISGDVTATVQYGPRVKALAVYLKAYHLIPFRRGAELITALFGGSIRGAHRIYRQVRQRFPRNFTVVDPRQAGFRRGRPLR